ncbi:MAG: hypothetical protein ACTSVW_02460 [Candidatus Njordarchaeales archaeon]
MLIKKRRVDNRGRIVIPLKNRREVFVLSYDDLVIISSSEKKLKEIGKLLNELKLSKKKKILEDWFELISELELDKLSPKDLDRLIADNLKRDAL